MPNGKIHMERMTLPATKIAEEFTQSGVVAAIRAAQTDKIRYPESLKRAIAAGTTAYWVL